MRVLTIAIALLAVGGCGGGGAAGPGGAAWRSYPVPGNSPLGIVALWASAPDDVWAASQTLLHFDGASFTEITDAPIVSAADFWGFAPNDVYSVSSTDLARWDGAAWTLVDFAGAIDPSSLTAVWGTSDDDLWLGDELNGRVYHWDGGAWSTAMTQTVSVNDLWGVSGGGVYAGGDFGVARWSGSAWTDIGSGAVAEATGMWGFADDDVWAVSDFGTMGHWTGAAWTDTLPANNDAFVDGHKSIWGPAPDDVWAVGDAGAISHWDGARWSQIQYGQFPFNPFLNKVHGSSANDVWIGGRRIDGTNGPIILHNL
jgi:hypothetical protein